MKKIIVGLFYLALVAIVVLLVRFFVVSTIASVNDLKFQKEYAFGRCHQSSQELIGVTGERVIEKYGSYYCYVQVKGTWTQLTDYDMDKILKIRQ